MSNARSSARREDRGSVEQARDRESERSDVRIELRAIVTEHLITALHRADRRFEHGAARIPESLAGQQVGLFADDAFAAHFLHFAVCIRDHPMACEQAGRNLALVANRDRIGEDVMRFVGLRLLAHVARAHVDANAMTCRLIGARSLQVGCGVFDAGLRRRYFCHKMSLQCRRTAKTSQGAEWRTASSVKLSRMASPWRSRLPSTMRSLFRRCAARMISALIPPVSTSCGRCSRPSFA